MEKGRPVISVKNVSMEFQVPLEGSSSLKEYLIKVFTGKNSSRTLKALKLSVLQSWKASWSRRSRTSLQVWFPDWDLQWPLPGKIRGS